MSSVAERHGLNESVLFPRDDMPAAGATSIANINKLVGELQTARDYRQAEGERVRRLSARDRIMLWSWSLYAAIQDLSV